MALTTLSSVKSYLGITGSDEDTLLNTFITQATAVINKYCLRTLEAAAYTEYYEGNGRPELVLRQYPINSLTSIHVDDDGYYAQGSGAFGSGDLLTEGVDYTYRSGSGIVYRIGSVWPARTFKSGSDLVGQRIPGYGNIKVIYNGGYSTVPDDLALAANMLISTLRRGAGNGGNFKSESLEYYSYTLADNEDEKQRIGTVMSILSKYRKKLLF